MHLFCAAKRECPLAHFVFLLSTQQTFFVSIKVLWESCQGRVAESGLSHKALSHALVFVLRTTAILKLYL